MKTKKRKISGYTLIIVFFCIIFLASAGMFGKGSIERYIAQSRFEDLASEVLVDAESNDTIHKRDIVRLKEMNPDCTGWIFIEGTDVDYPVMHTPDYPQKYLYKGFDGKYSEPGTPFLDYECNLESGNIIIYGHNMNNGKMFSDICNYLDDSFFAEHEIIEFETVEGCFEYRVSEVRHVHQTDDWYANLEPEDGREYLTLSTCYGRNDERLIVIAEKIK